MGMILQSLLTFVLLYKYAAIFVISFLAALSFPLPSSAILIASAFFATEGYFNFVVVYFVALFANIAGDLAAYWLARRYGEKVFLKVGLKKVLASQTMHLFEQKLVSHPYSTVIFSRFGSSITPIVSYLSGLAKMHHRTFTISVIIGEIADTALICALGYFFGENWTAIENVMSEVITAIILIILLVITIRWRVNRRKKSS